MTEGIPRAFRATDGARFEIHAHGAHVTSWVPSGGDERLFLSERSRHGQGTAIRGGIPVIFPQFAGRGPFPKHGFARTAEWTFVPERSGLDHSGAAVANLRLGDSEETRAIWPHRFEAELAVRAIAQSLDVTLTVANRDAAPFTFTCALHTYLRVADVERTRLHGLLGARYENSAAPATTSVETADDLAVAGELDRVYLDVKSPIEVREDSRRTRVWSKGFPDVVVWNPGPVRAATLDDMEPEGWRRMLCVEAAAIEAPIALDPGRQWSATQRLLAE